MGISGSEILRGERKEKGPKKDAFCQQKWASLGVKFQGGGKKRKRTKNVCLLPTEMGISGGEILRGEKKRKRTKKN